MDCEPLQCSTCRGTSRPRFGVARQCRNRAPWRRGRAVPLVCPFGLPLNGLPIGDNAPAEARNGPLPGKRRPDCIYGEWLSCCRVRCSDEETLRVTGQDTWPKHHCCPERCKNFAPRESEGLTHTATATTASAR